ncbi:iron ABC transporter substrate-binding protein [Streptomyces clavuligerus]|nr:iron ABC transporter substrate-binding protein [Streptomyces clavuligerus]ANW17491.1 iron ABC transporter substrate-binding protein [Streptomyces clavuligerus]AXU12036.1 iron ABC transporter substrate-binding protein [Streptomyces clavuligerus]MBY6301895.1 iron ABC transporter substrate-binding protein [Streptomyces clavuligerus]QCS04817.1 iron ABC transporter substrate-binding protein [Streptomyces clavuligerus]QPJ95808.1 extracellular solute-binding protein [Streptomyces clavuligerus]
MPRPSVRRGTALALSALLLPVLAACGGSDSEKNGKETEAGEQKGAEKLVIYSGRNEELISPIIGKLEKATGTDVEVRYGDSAELAAQILEEGDRTKAGLFFSQDAGALGALSQAGQLAKLPQKSLDKVDAAFRGGEQDWVGVSGRSRVIAYNPKSAGKVPDSIHDLTAPKWKGKVGYAPTNASFQAFVTGMRVLEGEDATLKWLKGLKANGKTYAKNGAVLDAVDSGEVSLGLINHYYWYEKVAELGEDKVNAKIHFLPGGDSGALINAAGVGVLKNGGQGAAAEKAVDYLLSKEAQTYFAEETKEYPLASGVTSTVKGLPALDSLDAPKIDLGKLESLQQTLELLKKAGMV